jgi:chromosome segregation protein
LFLKCIEMTGFKSFPEKTQMHMNGSITGVVGPNGSGKSNVSDAVRWVLGEQSAKSLRGSTMQDVIFTGTQKRKARNFCEVSLIFDNLDNRMNSEYSEIEVRRKLYRSGESEYYINGSKCRLKDILEMFRDTGIGKEGYSIIGQGRIDEILSEKSIDRRKVFEEASGIMKYRVRKEEAERKLEKTGQNLLRVEDILIEQNLQIKPLKRQAENAKVYLELSEKLKRLDVNLFLFNYDKRKQRIAKLSQNKQALAEDKAQKELVLKEFGDQYVLEQQNAKQIEEKGDEIAGLLSQAHAKIEHVEGEIKLCEEREQNLSKDSDRLKLEMDETDAKMSAGLASERTNAQRISALEGELATAREAASEAGREIAELSGVFEDRVRIIETVQSEKVDAIEKIADVKSAVSALEEKQRSAQLRVSEADERIAALEQQISAETKELEAAHKAQESLAAQQKQLTDSFNEKVYKSGKSKEQLTAMRSELESSRRDYATCASSAKLLSDMKNSFEGYKQSVARLMASAQDSGDIGRRIIGTFADVVNVPANYETAIEMCLGAALQNVVVQSEHDAKHIISYLRKENMGRVTFLPLDALKARTFTDKEKTELNGSGVVGIASELVSCSKGCEKAVDFLLGRTVIVQSADAAIALLKSCGFALRAVTLDGDIYNPSGSITGGSVSKNRGGLVSRERREEELSKRADTLKGKTSELESQLARMDSDLAQLTSDIETTRKSLQTNEIEIAKGKEKIDTLTSSAENAQQTITKQAQVKDEISSQAASFDKEIKGFAALQNDMQQSSNTKSEDYKRMEDEYRANAELIESKKALMHEAEIKIAELAHENTTLAGENLRLGDERHDAQKAKALKGKTIELNVESIENLLSLKNELTALLAQKRNALDELKQQQIDMIAQRGLLSEALSERDKKILKARQEHSDIAEKAMRVDFSIEKVQTDIEGAQNRLWETYQLTYANALPLREEIDMNAAKTQADDMRRKIRYLGNVNPNAIEDYAELKERMDSLETQKADLVKAGQDLEKLIVSLLSEMRKTFRDSFEQISKHFNKAFKDLFDGGRAELHLEEGVDIMDAGIEIVAEPPGKKLQKISLLSGGEKALTAISLLFALLKINPSPVCILDEIDAALDEANVYKFSDYLKKYAQNMQFIVITHRKPTMVICDSLFGFAMEEKGVSKLLSVRLD